MKKAILLASLMAITLNFSTIQCASKARVVGRCLNNSIPYLLGLVGMIGHYKLATDNPELLAKILAAVGTGGMVQNAGNMLLQAGSSICDTDHVVEPPPPVVAPETSTEKSSSIFNKKTALGATGLTASAMAFCKAQSLEEKIEELEEEFATKPISSDEKLKIKKKINTLKKWVKFYKFVSIAGMVGVATAAGQVLFKK